MKLSSKFDQVLHTNGGCWIWTGSLDYDGYPLVKHEGRCQRAHRVAWRLANGDIPSDMTIDHLCKNRACVNPSHLRMLSWDENCGPTRWGREWWLWRGRALKLQLEQEYAAIREKYGSGEAAGEF